MRAALLILLHLPLSAFAFTVAPSELEESVRRYFPLVEEAVLKSEAARQELVAAEGAFDTKLKVKSENRIDKKYDYRYLHSSIEKQLPVGGITIFGGHVQGLGEIPAYTGKYETAAAGEAFVGASLPLLRDRRIDEARLALISARLSHSIAEQEILSKKNLYIYKALLIFQKWKLAQKKYEVKEAMLKIAGDRQRMLEKKVRAGDTAKLSLVDGQRSLLKREEELLEARIEVENARRELGLYYRGPDGAPRDLTGALPEAAPLATAQRAPVKNLPLGSRKIPQLAIIEAEQTIARETLNFGRSQSLPALSVEAAGFRSLAPTPNLDSHRLQVGVFFEMPLENRKGRGKEASARAKSQALEKQKVYIEREIKTLFEQAQTTIRISLERLDIIARELRNAKEMAEAERRRWLQGGSDLFVVTSREQEAANVEIRLWSAQYDYEVGLLESRLAVGDFVGQ